MTGGMRELASLPSQQSVTSMTPVSLVRFCRKGMPAFGEQLNDTQIDALVKYVQARRGGRPGDDDKERISEVAGN